MMDVPSGSMLARFYASAQAKAAPGALGGDLTE